MKSVHGSTPVSRPVFNRIGTPPKQKAQEFFVFGVDAENRVWRIHVRGSMIGDEVELPVALGEGKGDITNIDRMSGEGASRTCT